MYPVLELKKPVKVCSNVVVTSSVGNASSPNLNIEETFGKIKERIINKDELAASAPQDVSIFTRVARRDLLQDDANEFLFMRPGQKLTQALVATDEKVIDGVVRGVGASAVGSARGMRKLQTGYVRNYALLILIGALVALVAVLVVSL